MGKEKINKHPNWMTSKGERHAYGAYLLGQNFFYTIVYMFLATYLLLRGLTPVMTGTVLIIVKIWDAVNDVIFGGIVDKVKFKNGGKFLPWVKISLLFIPVMTVLMFAIPGSLSSTMKLVWFAVAYILWDTAYTICDVPIYGLVTTLTDNQEERTNIMSLSRIYATIGSTAIALGGQVLTGEQVGMSFTTLAIIFAIVGLLVMLPICFKAKERTVVVDEKKEDSFTFKQMFTYLGKNKFLLIFYLGLFFYYSLNTAAGVAQFTAFYLFNNATLATVITLMQMLPALVAAALLPALVKKFDKFKMFFVCNAACAIIGVITWIVGYQSFLVHLVLVLLRGLFFGLVMAEMFMFTPDCAEYGQFKSGIEARGITFAVQTFSVKLMTAISAALPLFLLGFFGWQTVTAESFAELAALGVTQPQSALDGLWFVYALLPAIGSVIGTVIWTFYKLNDKDVEIMAKCNAGEITKEEAEAQLSRQY